MGKDAKDKKPHELSIDTSGGKLVVDMGGKQGKFPLMPKKK